MGDSYSIGDRYLDHAGAWEPAKATDPRRHIEPSPLTNNPRNVIQKYKPKETGVEAGKVSEQTADAIASWCGGEVVRDAKSSDPTDMSVWVKVPTLEGVISARVDWYVVKSPTGRFSVMTTGAFEAKYDPVRVDGVTYRGAQNG